MSSSNNAECARGALTDELMTEPVLLREIRGSVAAATLNRPRSMNALDAALRAELTEFWLWLRDAPGIRVGIVAGAGGRAFSSGRDLKQTAAADQAGHNQDFEASGEFGYPGAAAIGKPVIAAIDGYCLAAGLMIALGCDIRICSDTAVFGNPQVARGRGTRVPLHLMRAGVPRAVALDMVLTGRRLDAQEALRWGLVSRIVPQAALMDEAWALAEGIAGNSPIVVGGVKRAVDAGLLDSPGAESLARWDEVTGMMDNTSDAVEGARSFTEGRDGHYG